MQITRFQTKGFLCHDNTTVDNIPKVAMFVGPNAGGKSAFFDALGTFSGLLVRAPEEVFGPPPFSFGSKRSRGSDEDAMCFEATIECKDITLNIELSVKRDSASGEGGESDVRIVHEKISTSDEVVFDRNAGFSKLSGVDPASNDPAIAQLRRRLKSQKQLSHNPIEQAIASCGSFGRYRLEATELSRPVADPQLGDNRTPYLGYYGEGLAACLSWLREYEVSRFAAIEKKTRKLLPGFRRFLLTAAGADKIGLTLEFKDSRQRVIALWSSSGTMLYIGLLTLLHMPNTPQIVCIEEPENGIMTPLIRDVLSTINDEDVSPRQYLISTHSPFLLQDAVNCEHGLTREHVFQFRIDAEGVASVRRLDKVIADEGIQLQKGKQGSRTILGLKNAEDLLYGRYAK